MRARALLAATFLSLGAALSCCLLIAPSRDEFVGGTVPDLEAASPEAGVCPDASIYGLDHIGSAERLGRPVPGLIASLAVDDTWVFSADPLTGVGGRIEKAADAGFTVASVPGALRVALTDQRVFWASADAASAPIYSAQKSGRLMDAGAFVSSDGGGASSLAVSPSGDPVFWTASAANAIFRVSDGGVRGMSALGATAIATDAREFFFATSLDIRRRSIEWSGGDFVVVPLDARLGPSRITWLTLDTQYVYFSVKSNPCATDGAIYRAPRTGSAPSPSVLVERVATSEQFAKSEGGALYYATGTELMKLALDGSAAVALVSGLVGCDHGVATDAAFVYFTCAESIDNKLQTTLWRVRK